jgi:hypothetical protein
LLKKQAGFIFALMGICFLLVPPGTSLAAANATVNATIRITVCGNGIKEAGEECDNADFGGQSCRSRGYLSGGLSCSPACELVTTACFGSPPSLPSGGGGPVAGAPVETSVNFSGRAYPLSKITILKDGQAAITAVSGPDAQFNISLTGLSGGNYSFSVLGEDNLGRRSTLFTFPLYVTQGTATRISVIFLTPTIDVDKQEVKKGDNITIFGQTVPYGEVSISVDAPQELLVKSEADKNGVYLYTFNTGLLEAGGHLVKARAALDSVASAYSTAVSFTVGGKNVEKEQVREKAEDFNQDGKVNLIDFSILAYWYKRASPPLTVDLNNDGKVTLVDFSIMVSGWTG